MKISQATDEDIREFLSWKYEKPYEIYNIPDNYLELEIEETILFKENWFTVRKEGFEEIFGFFEFVFDVDDVEIGLGINPKYTDMGYGEEFVKIGISFLRKHYNEYRRDIILSVLSDNLRAKKVYERVGFVEYDTADVLIYGEEGVFICMRLED